MVIRCLPSVSILLKGSRRVSHRARCCASFLRGLVRPIFARRSFVDNLEIVRHDNGRLLPISSAKAEAGSYCSTRRAEDHRLTKAGRRRSGCRFESLSIAGDKQGGRSGDKCSGVFTVTLATRWMAIRRRGRGRHRQRRRLHVRRTDSGGWAADGALERRHAEIAPMIENIVS